MRHRDIEAIKYNPAAFYLNPADVLTDATLSKEEKNLILNQWAYDEREKEVAEEENMRGAATEQKSRLSEILAALQHLEETAK